MGTGRGGSFCHSCGYASVADCGSAPAVPGHNFSDFRDLSLSSGRRNYWTSYYIVTDQLNLALHTGYEAVKTAVAIVLGIVFVFELPQRIFAVFRKRKNHIKTAG